MWELINNLGSLGGLISFIYLGLTYFFKGRPTASIMVADDQREGLRMFRAEAFIRIKNENSYDIFISNVDITPAYYLALQNGKMLNLVKAITGGSPKFLIEPNDEAKLELFKSTELHPKSGDKFQITISWRSGKWTWGPQIPLKLFLDVKTVEQMRDAASSENAMD